MMEDCQNDVEKKKKNSAKGFKICTVQRILNLGVSHIEVNCPRKNSSIYIRLNQSCSFTYNCS